eukprot:9477094-Pyramimonas_sp.AAC.2
MSEESAAGGMGRKLKPSGSNPEAPDKKAARTEAEGLEDDDERETPMPSWARMLMNKMDGVQSTVDGMTGKVERAVAEAAEAKTEAKQASLAVKGLEESMVTKQELPELVKGILQEGPTIAGGVHVAGDPEPVIFGGLKGAGAVEEAEQWVNHMLNTAGLPRIINPYIKSENFENIMFAQFPSRKTADAAIELFRRKQPTFKEAVVWCNIDRPLHARISLKLLFKLKKILGGWGFKKGNITIDEENTILKVGGVSVAKAQVHGGALTVEWPSKEWKDWKELQDSQELKDLIQQCQTDLAHAYIRQSKGLGKGKPQPA